MKNGDGSHASCLGKLLVLNEAREPSETSEKVNPLLKFVLDKPSVNLMKIAPQPLI